MGILRPTVFTIVERRRDPKDRSSIPHIVKPIKDSLQLMGELFLP